MPEKKKKNKNSDDEEDDEIYDDEFFNRLNDQMKDIMKHMPFKLPYNVDFNNDYFRKMFKNLMKNLNVDPSMVGDMQPEDFQEIMKNAKINFKGPFMFGFNMQADKDGKPTWSPFGNVKPQSQGEPEVQSERDPLVDIYEEDNFLVVVCEVPGVSKKDIELRASKNELEITAESSLSSEHARKYHKIIPLPADIDPDYAKARYNNGILEVRLKIIKKSRKKKKIEFVDDDEE